MLDVARSRIESSEGHHYRPQLNPEFARRAREKNKLRDREAAARRKAQDQERRREAAQAAIEAARASAKEAELLERAKPIEQAKPVGAEHVKEALVTTEMRRTEFQRILIRLMPVLDVTITELRSPRRSRHLVFARQAICYWACRRTELSLPQIGKLMGGRDHTTILHSKNAYPGKRAEMGRKLRRAR